MSLIPSIRVRNVNGRALDRRGRYVVYWMVAARRVAFNFALDRAIELARDLDVPLIVLEPLRLDYPWASDRLHHFVIEGMRENARALASGPIGYYPYVESIPGQGKGLLPTLAKHACAIVTDDYPCFFIPRMIEAASRQVEVRFEAIDGNGIYPMRATRRVFTTAASFRRHLQKELATHLTNVPRANSVRRLQLPTATIPANIARRWKPGIPDTAAICKLKIDHGVGKVKVKGGARAARLALRTFIDQRLTLYAEQRNQPDADAQSHLSPYLHFGHISAHEVFRELMVADDWSADRLAPKASGSRHGFWGASRNVEAFLDELITWRELGFNRCAHDAAYASMSSLPSWAKQTLHDHANDPRPHLYTLAQFEAAETADPLWNAAQRQLVRDGTIHNYLRMLWGKKILEWTRSPSEALEIMIELNNKYALDGRDPNSYSGMFWVLGRYDRAWGPERAVFGKVRYMSSGNTARKIRVKSYLEQYAA